MAAPWLGCWEAPARALRGLAGLGRDFAAEWEAQDLRAALFQLLLLWLGLSLVAIQLAWRVYGGAVTALCCRPGMGGQNGGTPDGSSHFSSWESSSTESVKTHRE
ncbi:PREDICTED: T-cell leukemia translocation-altered gene protein [Crocodylus porosus]|uniref:T-cell leukemia translocation-altered gene protein homolog n=1 Tax=Crocodylus porosus TaxID=8502 RepID=A0A7M4FAH0_CROPO|nr:PREDICTED: T-cell leukemia translocation-altered gene protein [Crocodylus porosus]